MTDESQAQVQAEPKLADAVAEREFQRFGDAFDLDFDRAHMDEEDRQGFEQLKRTFIRYLKRGNLKVNEHGFPCFKPVSDSDGEIMFKEPRGSAFTAIDAKKETHWIAKKRAFAASMTGQNEVRFENMAARDWKVVSAIVDLCVGG